MKHSASKAINPALALVLSSTALCQTTTHSETWTDPDTQLVWTAKDNGKDISWKAAASHCHKLRLSGFSDWRLPAMIEAQALYDKLAASPGTMGLERYHNVDAATWHIRGNIFLTGTIWIDQNPKERCLWTCYAPHFDFNEGKADVDPAGWPYPFDGMRALCVRGSQTKAQSGSNGGDA